MKHATFIFPIFSVLAVVLMLASASAVAQPAADKLVRFDHGLPIFQLPPATVSPPNVTQMTDTQAPRQAPAEDARQKPATQTGERYVAMQLTER